MSEPKIIFVSERRYLSVEGLMAKFTYSRSAVASLRRQPGFPRPFRLAPGAADRWDEAEIDAFAEARKEASAIEDGETPGVRAAVARLISSSGAPASSGPAPAGGRRGRGACSPRSAAPSHAPEAAPAPRP